MALLFLSPGPDGFIRVACGDDTLEIFVLPPRLGHFIAVEDRAPEGIREPPRGQDQSRKGQVPSPFENPYAMLKERVSGKVGDWSHIDSIVEKVRARIRSANHPNPDGVILPVSKSLDVHWVKTISTRFERDLPGVGLAFQFGKDKGVD